MKGREQGHQIGSQGVLCMRVHSPLEDGCDPLSIYMNWVPSEPPVGSAVTQVGSPIDWGVG